MRILLWHGYLLRGSGSNIFKANIVRAWREDGHDVLLLCQERDLEGLDFIDAHGDFAPDNHSHSQSATGASPGPGRATLLRPAIGDILPVYVFDRYEGFTAKTYVDLTDDELRSYTDRNIEAMVHAIESWHPDLILTSHEVMGPWIAARACERTNTTFAAQLHGSALEYAVKQQERYLQYAIEGLVAASAVMGGSRYMVREAGALVPGWADRAHVVNPGCDVELFRPDERRLGAPVVGYVGKFIAQKGVHNLLAALGLTSTPDLRAVIVGFGELDASLRELVGAAQSGDARAMERVARAAGMTHVVEFLTSGTAGPNYFARAGEVDVEFTGRLEHGPLSRVLPGFDVLVVPSILSEAFGMVGAEAAACGVLPVVPDHSGIAEVGTAVEAAIGHPGLLVYDPERPIEAIAERVDEILALPSEERRTMSAAAAALAREHWSWSKVARALIAAATAR